MPRGGFRPNAGRPKGSTKAVVDKPAVPKPVGKKTARTKKRGPQKRETEPQVEVVFVVDQQSSDGPRFETALDFLKAVWQGRHRPSDVEMKAAIAALPFSNPKLPEAPAPGKKENAQEAAEKAASGLFAPPSPPKLAVDNTTR